MNILLNISMNTSCFVVVLVLVVTIVLVAYGGGKVVWPKITDQDDKGRGRKEKSYLKIYKKSNHQSQISN